MPYLQIRTNCSCDDSRALLEHASAVIADALGKSERFVMTSMASDQTMTFGGSSEPCAYLELKSLGLATDQTNELSQTLARFMKAHLGIPEDRIYIEFTSGERAMWGWNGTTFAK